MITKYWQCSKCKKLYMVSVKTIKKTAKIRINDKIVKKKIKAINPNETHKVKCCHRLLRNLSEEVYIKEKQIDDSGIRGAK